MVSKVTFENVLMTWPKGILFVCVCVPLQQAYNNIVVDLDLAQREDFYFGAKLVRGAYMEQVTASISYLGVVWCHARDPYRMGITVQPASA